MNNIIVYFRTFWNNYNLKLVCAIAVTRVYTSILYDVHPIQPSWISNTCVSECTWTIPTHPQPMLDSLMMIVVNHNVFWWTQPVMGLYCSCWEKKKVLTVAKSTWTRKLSHLYPHKWKVIIPVTTSKLKQGLVIIMDYVNGLRSSVLKSPVILLLRGVSDYWGSILCPLVISPQISLPVNT